MLGSATPTFDAHGRTRGGVKTRTRARRPATRVLRLPGNALRRNLQALFATRRRAGS